MGVVFQRRPRYESVMHHIDVALSEQPPESEQARQARVTELAKAATSAAAAPVAMNWRAFLLALIIFVGLLGLAIVLDWANVVDNPAAYTGLAGTALGAVLGFLTGDAAATLSES
jgi:hypothetical protein